MLDVSQAPESPGLYAWYVTFRAGPHDWKFRPSPQGDQAIVGFLNLLRKYAGYYEPHPLVLSARGAYGAKWAGRLELTHPLRAQSEDDPTDKEDPLDDLPQLAKALDAEEHRRILAMILQKATPAFSAPLYIGVAENLRQRLSQHQQDFARTQEWLQEHPEDAEIVKTRGKSFGQRAAARNIAMEHLEAWIIELSAEEDDGITKKSLRSTAESAEWLLQRLYSPILGRQ